VRAEYEVLAHDDHSCSKSVEELALYELLCGEAGEVCVESKNVDLIGTRGAQ
jgi:hypothetical protein